MHIPIPLVFTAFRRLQLPKTSVGSVFGASGFARFRKWRIHRYLQVFFGFLCLKGHKIWHRETRTDLESVALFWKNAVNYSTSLYAGIYVWLYFRSSAHVLQGFYVLSMTQDLVS